MAHVRLKKKEKRGNHRCCTLKAQNLIKEQLLENTCLYFELQPSTSDKSLTTPKAKCSSRKYSDLGTAPTTGESNVHIQENVAAIASDYHLQKDSAPVRERNQQSENDLASDDRTIAPKNNLVCKHAKALVKTTVKLPLGTAPSNNKIVCKNVQGLEKTTVARCDEREANPSTIFESNDEKSFRIGYVPYEW